MINYKIAVAEKLLQIKAIKLSPQRPFTWASGIKSPIYCDNRLTLSFPEVRNLVKNGFYDLAKQFEGVNTIAGVATAGIAHGVLLAEAMNLPYVYVRSSAKEHGRQNLIEGQLNEGAKVLLVEDLISTGGSSIKAANALQEAGAEVIAILAVFTYGFEKAKINFEKAGIPYYTISDYRTLLDIAQKENYISNDEKLILDKWNQNPEKWYNQNF